MNTLLKIVIFVIVSGYLLWLSRKSIGSFKSHGLYRLLSWEVLLIMVLLNTDYWFRNPFSNIQIISWIMLLISIGFVITGAISLKRKGRPDDKRDDPKLIGIERTTRLINSGIYKYVRHPLYASFIFGGLGIALKNLSWVNFALAGILMIFAFLTAVNEERMNIEFFGHDYIDYMKKTKRFIPFIF